jgi:hypothetical protein
MSDRDFMGERGDQGQRGVAGERGPKGDHGQHGEVGAAGPQGERGRDAKSWRLWPTLRLLAFVLVAAASIFAAARTYDIAAENKATIERVEENQRKIALEGVQRRDQICLAAEREHASHVTRLTRTYEYIVSLPAEAFDPKFAANQINLAVLRQLPQTEDEAKSDVAPEFCDVTLPGNVPVGMPEPDPIVPERPEKIDQLLKDLK